MIMLIYVGKLALEWWWFSKKDKHHFLPAFVAESVSYNIDYVLNDAYIGTVLVTNCDYFR